MKKFYILTIITLVLGLFLPALPASAADVYFSISPASGSYYVGNSFSVNIMIGTGGEDTDSADAILYYDPNYLEVLDSLPSIPGIQVQPGSTYQVYPGNEVNTSTGRIRVTGFSVSGPYNSGSGSGVFATISFRVKQAGSTNLSFEFTPGDSHDCNVAQTGTSIDILNVVYGASFQLLPDNRPPYIINFNPASGASGVSPSTNITFNIRDDETAVNINSVRVNVNGDEYTANGPLKFTYSGSSKNYSITVDPASNFDYEQTVNVTVQGSDTAGNSTTYNSSFITAPAPVNEPPVLADISDKIVYGGSTLVFLVTATDPNGGDQLNITMSDAPPGATLSRVSNGRYLFSWTTTVGDIGSSYLVNFQVVDNGTPPLSDSGSVNISVIEAEEIIPEEQRKCPPCPPCGQRTQCSDNRDNDDDGLLDYPEDPQCIDYYDEDELAMGPFRLAFSKIVDGFKDLLNRSKVGRFVLSGLLKLTLPDGQGHFSLSPASGNFYLDQTFSVNILVGTDNADTDAADVVLSYDPNYLEVVDALPGTAGIQIQPGTIYEAYPGNIVDSSSGIIRITGFSVLSTFNSGAGTGVFATINFKAKQVVANTEVNFDFTPGVTTDSNLAMHGTSEDILSSVTNGSYTIIPDAKPPYVTDFLPANGSTNRSINQNISFHIKDDETGVDINSLRVRVEEQEYTASSAQLTYSGNIKDYFVAVNLPTFNYDQVVDIYIDAQDTQGNTMSTYYSQFRTMPMPENHPPSLDPISNKIAYPGSVLSFLINASDPDSADVLTYSMQSGPPGSSLTKVSNNQALFEWTPPVNSTEIQYIVMFKVEDNGSPRMSDEQAVTISVTKEVEELPEELICPPCPVCPQCLDSLDNDDDGLIDYPNDPGCESQNDDDETDEGITQCSDGQDNDDDGLIDYPNDPGCESAADNDEIDEFLPQCSDGQDNDDDGLIDYPNDPGCESAADNDEIDVIIYVPQCSDGSDNDDDGLIDYPADLGCLSPEDDDERNPQEVIVAAIEDAVDIVIEQTFDNPVVEKRAEEIATPVLAAIAVANTASAGFSLINILIYLQYIFTEPLRALFRKKRKAWGVVYNSLTKKPVDLAIVRLYNREDGKLVKTRVTDAQGRFFFVVPPGEYYIKVAKPQFVFPSEYLKGKVVDSKYLDLYYGGTISVTEEKTNIVPNIPLDPVGVKPATDRRVIFRLILRKIQYIISFSGVSVAALIVVIIPTKLTVGLLIFHVLMYLAFRRLGKPRKPKGWGIVRDKDTKKPLGRTVVRIFDQEYNKLLETQVTDPNGRYGFLVGANVYYLTASKPAYVKVKTHPLDLTGWEEGAVVAKNINLKKGEGEGFEEPETFVKDIVPEERVEETGAELKDFGSGEEQEVERPEIEPEKEVKTGEEVKEKPERPSIFGEPVKFPVEKTTEEDIEEGESETKQKREEEDTMGKEAEQEPEKDESIEKEGLVLSKSVEPTEGLVEPKEEIKTKEETSVFGEPVKKAIKKNEVEDAESEGEEGENKSEDIEKDIVDEKSENIDKDEKEPPKPEDETSIFG